MTDFHWYSRETSTGFADETVPTLPRTPTESESVPQQYAVIGPSKIAHVKKSDRDIIVQEPSLRLGGLKDAYEFACPPPNWSLLLVP